MKFREILNKHWWKLNYKISNYQIYKLRESLDIDEIIKRNLTEQIRQKISEKIKIEKTGDQQYPKITEDDGLYRNYPTFNQEPTTEYKTEIIILNKEDLFDLFYSFNQLSESEKESVMKNLALSEEYYINQVRSDKLDSILMETWCQEINFSPGSINI